MKNTTRFFFVLAMIAAFLTAGCTQQQAQLTPQPTQEPTLMPTVQVTALPSISTIGTAASTFGICLVDSRGKTLYYFANDLPGSGASACGGQCAAVWPAVTADTTTVESPLDAMDFASLTRADGTKQTTYKGRPLYAYTGDTKPGDVNGQGIGGVWYVANIPGTIPPVTTQPATFHTLSPSGGGYGGGY